jgi:hypothetical protein
MLGIRWTIGDVSPRAFAALRASLWGAWRLFGRASRYRVYVHAVAVDDARRRCGETPGAVEWCAADAQLAPWLARFVDRGMAQGAAWKLVPVRAFPDEHELALDPGVILWDIPPAVRGWLEGATRFVLAEDARPSFGRFAGLCGERPLDSGIRGIPPDFDLAAALAQLLARSPGTLETELDEQGLQVAALVSSGTTAVVAREDVPLCSPAPPHMLHLGRSGVHFVGYDAWERHAPEVLRRVGL